MNLCNCPLAALLILITITKSMLLRYITMYTIQSNDCSRYTNTHFNIFPSLSKWPNLSFGKDAGFYKKIN
jgi:hypothetical protein